MLKKDELTNPASCLNKAGARERIFVLRENDPLFAQTVRHWATMADGVHEPAKIKEAAELAAAAERARIDRNSPACEPAPFVTVCTVKGCNNVAESGRRNCALHHD